MIVAEGDLARSAAQLTALRDDLRRRDASPVEWMAYRRLRLALLVIIAESRGSVEAWQAAWDALAQLGYGDEADVCPVPLAS